MIHFKPSLSPTRKQPNIEQQLQQATAYIEQRLYAEAETLARDMIRHAPELDVAYQILGLSLSEQNIPEKYPSILWCVATFQRRRLENDWPPNPLNGGFLDCTENDFFCAWQTFQRRRLENVSCGWRYSLKKRLKV